MAADVHIKGIKLLHKRYSTAEWTTGVSVNGTTVIPKLAQGEIGLNTNTLEVRVGTNALAEQSWAEAQLISAGVEKTVTYYYADGTTGTTAKSEETYVCTDTQIESQDNGSYKFTATFKEINLVSPKVTIPDLKVTEGTTTVESGEISVITGVSGGNVDGVYKITTTKGTAATKAYVDSKTITVDDTGSGAFITDITSDGHTITVSRGSVDIDFPEISIDDTATGDYVKGITVDEKDDHKLILTKGTLPSGTGSKTAGDAEFIDSVSLSGHTLTATSKAVKGDGKVISVVKDTDGGIKISADTYTKAEIDAAHNDLAKAMKFVGTIASDGTGTITTLPKASTSNQGNVYKVIQAGTYNSQACKVGDLFISDGTVWRYVPSGDETFTDTWRSISVNGEVKFDNSIGGNGINFVDGNATSIIYGTDGSIKINHTDTSNVENLDAADRTYVKSLTFDEYGHVTGYAVGTETDQVIPDASGSATVGTLKVLSGVTLGADHTLSKTGEKTLAATGKLNVAETNDTITFTHKDVTKNDTTSTVAPEHKGTFTVVDSVARDDSGHVTGVNTKTVTLPDVPDYENINTTYDLTTNTDVTTAGSTAVDINLVGSDTITDTLTIKADSATTTPTDGLSIKVEGDTITLTGKATAALLGMIRAAYALDADDANVSKPILKNYSGNNNDKLYGVNVKKDGTAFVEVPWTDTKAHASLTDITVTNGANAVDLYAIGTDKFGHVNGVGKVAILDGNLA